MYRICCNPGSFRDPVRVETECALSIFPARLWPCVCVACFVSQEREFCVTLYPFICSTCVGNPIGVQFNSPGQGSIFLDNISLCKSQKCYVRKHENMHSTAAHERDCKNILLSCKICTAFVTYWTPQQIDVCGNYIFSSFSNVKFQLVIA